VLLFGICPISFGIIHIVDMQGDMPGLLGWIPGWLPPTKMFWAYEIVIFELLVWIPNLYKGPGNHFNWAGNAICIALAGASWVVSDSISAAARTELIVAESAAR